MVPDICICIYIYVYISNDSPRLCGRRQGRTLARRSSHTTLSRPLAIYQHMNICIYMYIHIYIDRYTYI